MRTGNDVRGMSRLTNPGGPQMDTAIIERLCELVVEYGGEWGLQHANRLMALVEKLGAGMDYDADTIAMAAYMHDWGGYSPWITPGIEHQDRSAEVAEQWFRENGVPESVAGRVLECIRCHHGGPADRSIESRLFTDADALDLLGVVGVCRIFSMWYRDLRTAVGRVERFRDMSMAAITLPQTSPLAEERLRETNDLLKRFEEEALGIY